MKKDISLVDFFEDESRKDVEITDKLAIILGSEETVVYDRAKSSSDVLQILSSLATANTLVMDNMIGEIIDHDLITPENSSTLLLMKNAVDSLDEQLAILLSQLASSLKEETSFYVEKDEEEEVATEEEEEEDKLLLN